jgi:hypothetical protein
MDVPFFVIFYFCKVKNFAKGLTLNRTRTTVGVYVCAFVCVRVCVYWVYVFYSSDARMSLYAYDV